MAKRKAAKRRPAAKPSGITVVRESTIERTPRVVQLEGLFDVQPGMTSRVEWQVDLPVSRDDDDWNVGLIVGPSGCGKTTIATELFSRDLITGFDWPADKCLLDGFPDGMSIKDITGLLSSVGFSSPPNWLRPFGVLSNGEQFRSTVARAMAESPDLAVIDEFTSVVDRTVAKIGSAAIAKSVRRRNQKLVAVACHFDIIDWLDPDWIYEPLTGEFQRRRERRRPEIKITIRKVHHSAWAIFRGYHYLSHSITKAAHCFVAFVDGQPAAFCSVLVNFNKSGRFYREHRTVCRPDFQGVGIGNALSEYVMGLFAATGKRVFSTTSSPSMIRHRDRSPLWRRTRNHGFVPSNTKTLRRMQASDDPKIKKRLKRSLAISRSSSVLRMTSSFRYVGPARMPDAIRFGIVK